MSHGTYNVNGEYVNDGLVYLHADAEDVVFNVTGGGHMIQGPEGLVQVVSIDGVGADLAANLRVDGQITGAGSLYIEDETVCQGSGLVAGTEESPIQLFDATPALDRLCDIQSGTLERANVDITEELVALISAQRNFQANAKAIETANAMTQAVMNLRQ